MRTIHAATPFAIRLSKALSESDMRLEFSIPGVIGCIIVFVGCAVEADGQLNLLRSAGLDAYDAYRTFHFALAMSLSDWMQSGLNGTLTSFRGQHSSP